MIFFNVQHEKRTQTTPIRPFYGRVSSDVDYNIEPSGSLWQIKKKCRATMAYMDGFTLT